MCDWTQRKILDFEMVRTVLLKAMDDLHCEDLTRTLIEISYFQGKKASMPCFPNESRATAEPWSSAAIAPWKATC